MIESCEICGSTECSQADEERGRAIFLCNANECNRQWNIICRDAAEDEYDRDLYELNVRHGRSR